MCIAHGRVGQQHALFGQHPLGEALGTELIELLLRPRGGSGERHRRERRGRQINRPRTSPGLGAAVHDDLPDVGEETRRAIALARPAE